jgi:hypothetical protein
MRAIVGLQDVSKGDSGGVVLATSDGAVQVRNKKAAARDAEGLTYLVQAFARLRSVRNGGWA